MKNAILFFCLLFFISANARQDTSITHRLATVPVLCYHQVRDWKTTDSKFDRTFIIPVATFAQHIKTLHEKGYTPILPYQLINYANNNSPLPSKPILITFDDGTASQFENALPILEQYNIKAAFFIMTVAIGHKAYLSRFQIRALSDRGFEICCHTWDHQAVMKYTNNADYERQFHKPKIALEQISGKKVLSIAYPYGVWDSVAITQLKAYGYKAAFQLKGVSDPHAPLFTIRRLLVDAHWDASKLLEEISSMTK